MAGAHMNVSRKEVWMEEPRRWALCTVKGRAASTGSWNAAHGVSPVISPQLNSAQKLLAPAMCGDTPAPTNATSGELGLHQAESRELAWQMSPLGCRCAHSQSLGLPDAVTPKPGQVQQIC